MATKKERKPETIDAQVSAVIKSAHFILIYEDKGRVTRVLGGKTGNAEQFGLLQMGKTMAEYEICRQIASNDRQLADIDKKANEVMEVLSAVTESLDGLAGTAATPAPETAG